MRQNTVAKNIEIYNAKIKNQSNTTTKTKKEHSKKASKSSISAKENDPLPLANVKSFNFQEIYQLVVDNEQNMNTEGKDVIIFLGVSQTGKSSTINALRGVKFDFDGDFLKVVDDSKVAKVAGMGKQDGISHTKTPSIYPVDNFLLIDTQGLYDTKEDEYVDKYEVSGSYLIQMAIEKAKSVRCICMVKYSDLAGGVVEFNKIGKFLQRFFICVPKVETDFVPIHFLFNKYTAGEGTIKEYFKLSSEGRIEYIKNQIIKHCNNMIEGVRKNQSQTEHSYFKLFSDNIYSDNFSYVDPTDQESIRILKNRLITFRTIDKSYICIDRFSKRRQRFEIEFLDKIQNLTNALKKNLIGIKYPKSLFNQMISLIDEKINLLNNNLEALSNFTQKSSMSDTQMVLFNQISKDFNDESKVLMERQEQDLKKYKEDLANLETLIKSYDEIDERPIFRDFNDTTHFFTTSTFVVDYPKNKHDELPIIEYKEELGPDTQKKITHEPNSFHAEYSSGGFLTRIKMARNSGEIGVVFKCLRCTVSIELFTLKKYKSDISPIYQSLLAKKDQITENIEGKSKEIENLFQLQQQNLQKNIQDIKQSYMNLKTKITQKSNSMNEFYNNIRINMTDLHSCINISKKLNRNSIPIYEIQHLNEQIEQLEAQNKKTNKMQINDIDDILNQIDVDVSSFIALENASLNINQNSTQNVAFRNLTHQTQVNKPPPNVNVNNMQVKIPPPSNKA